MTGLPSDPQGSPQTGRKETRLQWRCCGDSCQDIGVYDDGDGSEWWAVENITVVQKSSDPAADVYMVTEQLMIPWLI